jgi:hypothetical protein
MVKVPEPLSAFTAEETLCAQIKDSWCQDLKIRLQSSPGKLKDFFVSNDELLCYPPVQYGLEAGVVVTASLRDRLMTLYHFPAIYGHVGT